MFFLQQDILFDTGSVSELGNNVGASLRSSSDLTDFINEIIAYAFLLAGLLSVIFIFWGGIQLIIGAGDDEKVKKAVGTIRHSFIGLVVTVLSFTAVAFLGGVFGLNLVGYISRDKIFEVLGRVTGSF